MLGVWAVQTRIANNARTDVAHMLTIVRDTTHLALKTWFKDQKAAAMVWADDPKIRESTAQLLTLPPHQSKLQNSPAQQALRAWFLRMQKATHYRGFFVVGPNHINLASSRDQNIGVENLLVGQEDFLAGIWAGRPAISLPTRSDVPLTDSQGRLVIDLPSMFVAAPIRNNAGEVMAIFMFRLDPEEGFTNILKQGRIGNTGETYAFDSEGRLMSQSRFDDRLYETGLILAGERSMLNLLLRDPGENLIKGGEAIMPRNQQPLTHMAKLAIRGEVGVDSNGYRDYRGVPVVGAWVWDTELGLGISTEQDVQEAYQTLNATRLTIVTLTIFMLFLLIGATTIYSLYRQRKQTEEALRDSNQYNRMLFDEMTIGLALFQMNGELVDINPAYASILGRTVEKTLKLSYWDITPEKYAKDEQAQTQRLEKTGRYGPYEKEYIHADGHLVPVRLSGRLLEKDGNKYIWSSVEDITERKQAHHDTLTGLPNRLRFIANLEQAIESAKRHNHKVALMFLDLDRFKYINDTFGHNIGDRLLKTIAERLKNCVRAEDTVARLGGDEFTVVLTEVAKAEDAGLIADKIIKIVRKPVTLGTHTIDTTISMGISIFPDDAVDSQGMINAADTAMYHAKAMGKNSFQFITAELALRTFKHVQIEQDLRKAIENKEFELYYQPQINLNDGKVAGVEALIRWNHPDHGQLLPEEFIQVADDSNLINAITDWILRTALNDYEYWTNNGSIGPRIAVNITGRQITSEPSTKCLLNVLEDLKSKSSTLQLDLEITETTLESTERAIDIINTLKDFGVMFAIDDFGTGHSSLSRLKQLPVDTLKIDRSFISKIADEGNDKAIAAAIIAIAHSLGLRVIAEGVETQSQLDVLQALGCDEIQGFYFSKPVPASEIPRLLEKSFL